MTGQAPATEKKGAANILFGEDQKSVRNLYARILQEDLGCKVQKPTAFEELADRIAVQVPDGLIMDYNLKKEWTLSPLNGEGIHTGLDVITFCQKINPIIPMCLYSQQPLLDDHPSIFDNHPSIFVIDKANNDYHKVKKDFSRFITPVNKVRRFFERNQPKKVNETLESKLNKYRILLKIFRPWLDYGFKKADTPHWTVLSDREIKMYGVPLSKYKEHPKKLFDVRVEEKYPSTEKLNYLNQNSDYESLVFWAAYNERIVDDQFDTAGSSLQEIPPHLLEYFSICMVPSCVKLYLDGDEKKALERAAIFGFSSRLEFVRNIFKEIPSSSEREKFKLQCAEAKLPVVHSIFKGRIDEISKSPFGKKTAWVILEKVHSKKRLSEPFNYALLRAQEIKYENELFEYAVYKQPHTTSSSITPDYEIWDDFHLKTDNI